MLKFTGKGVYGAVAVGRASVFFQKKKAKIRRTGIADVEAEFARVEAAKEKATQQLSEIYEKALREVGETNAQIFEIHMMMLEDEDYKESIRNIIETQLVNAEYAISLTANNFSSMFAAMDDAYMQARAADVKDISDRLITCMTADCEKTIHSDQPSIICNDDLTPSETVLLDKEKILAFVTAYGSSNSHTAILARTMGIPAICGLGEGLRKEFNNRLAYIDGETGCLFLDPDELTLLALKEKYDKQQEMKELLQTMKGQEDMTLDGKKVNVYCNIGSPEDVAAVLANDGQGIGLFRSEFLYLAASDYPTEEEQFQAYKAVAAAMNGKRVIIRTLDIGADKQVDYFDMKKEENPALGVRAIRICLNRPEVFGPQLRALYRASAYGKIAIMFPMITSVWEVKECKRACQKVMAELDKEGIPYNKDTEIGIMIETPASVFVADALAKEVDFFSVGTNDLTQYTLACDRQCNDLGKFYDPHHPAVLRALKMAADAAHNAGIWIGICGELGADLSLLETFLALGMDELSVSPSSVLPLRAAIRKSIAKTCTLEMLEC